MAFEVWRGWEVGMVLVREEEVGGEVEEGC